MAFARDMTVSLATMSSIPNLTPRKDGDKKSRKEYGMAGGGGHRSSGASSGQASSSSGSTETSSIRKSRYLDYGSLDNGIFERALANDQLLRRDLRRKKHEQEMSVMNLQPGDQAAKEADAKLKKLKSKGLGIFRRRASITPTVETDDSSEPSLTSPSDFSLSSFPTTGSSYGSSEGSSYSMASTDDVGSIAFSNFTAPSWLLADEDDASPRSSSTHSLASTICRRRTRSQSPASSKSIRNRSGHPDDTG